MSIDPFENIDRHFLTRPDDNAGVVLLNDAQRESRLKGKDVRAEIVQKYGFVPRSILYELASYHDPALDEYIDDGWGRVFQNAFKDTRRTRRRTYERELAALKKVIGDDFDTAVWEKRYEQTGLGLSQFGVRIAVFCIRMWSNEGDTMFDPFSGRLPRLLLAHKLKRHAIGYDLSKGFARWNLARLERLKQEESEKLWCEEAAYQLSYTNGDSRKVHLADATADYVLTSPPYWHQEFYGNEPEQLGWIGTYQDFLDGMLDVLRECYRVLKPGGFCTYVIQNMRDSDGSYVHYTADLSVLMRQAGFKIWDEAVYQIGALTAISNKNEAARHTAKTHESIITARKMPVGGRQPKSSLAEAPKGPFAHGSR